MRKRLKMLASRNITVKFNGAFVDGLWMVNGWLMDVFVDVTDGEIA